MNPLMSLLTTVVLSCLGLGEEPNYEGKTLSQWTAQTQHESSQLRQQAAHALAVIVMQSQDAAAAAALMQLLQDKDAGVRDYAFRELYHCVRTLNRPWPAAKNAIPALEKLAAQASTRWAAIDALGCMGPEAVPALIRLAAQPGVSDRRSIVLALTKIGREGAKESVPFLLTLLDDQDAALRQSAIHALGGMGAEGKSAVPTLLKLLRDKSPSIHSAAGSTLSVIARAVPEDVVPALTALARDPDVEVRRSVVLALSRTEAQEAIPVFRQALEDADQGVRVFAVWGLAGAARQGDKDVIAALTGLLRDQDSQVRFWAAKTLGATNPEAVWEAVQNEAPAIRAVAARALGSLGRKEALPALRRLLQDEAPEVRVAAVDGMGFSFSPDALPELKQLLQEPNVSLRVAAVAALGGMRSAEARALVMEALRNPDPPVRTAAVAALAKHFPRDGKAHSETLQVLRRVAEEDTDEQVRSAAAQAYKRAPVDGK